MAVDLACSSPARACRLSLPTATVEQVDEVAKYLIANLPLFLVRGVEHGVQCDADVHRQAE
jgi:hypothetical protein